MVGRIGPDQWPETQNSRSGQSTTQTASGRAWPILIRWRERPSAFSGEITVGWYRYFALTLLVAMLLMGTPSAVAQDQAPVEEAGEPTSTESAEASDANGEEKSASQAGESADLPNIEVVGSRIKRTELEGPAPVIIIDREEIDRRGFVSVFDALQALSINTGFQLAPPEFEAGFTPDAQTVNLRGKWFWPRKKLLTQKTCYNPRYNSCVALWSPPRHSHTHTSYRCCCDFCVCWSGRLIASGASLALPSRHGKVIMLLANTQ